MGFKDHFTLLTIISYLTGDYIDVTNKDSSCGKSLSSWRDPGTRHFSALSRQLVTLDKQKRHLVVQLLTLGYLLLQELSRLGTDSSILYLRMLIHDDYIWLNRIYMYLKASPEQLLQLLAPSPPQPVKLERARGVFLLLLITITITIIIHHHQQHHHRYNHDYVHHIHRIILYPHSSPWLTGLSRSFRKMTERGRGGNRK